MLSTARAFNWAHNWHAEQRTTAQEAHADCPPGTEPPDSRAAAVSGDRGCCGKKSNAITAETPLLLPLLPRALPFTLAVPVLTAKASTTTKW